jgi:tetratricopeptide (TPR) repeat protein
MKRLFRLFIFTISILFPLSAFSLSSSDPYTFFSMGYYYLYNNDLKMAKKQFELCLSNEKDPPAVLYTILSEISDMLGDNEEAELYATKALEIDPENETALQFKALFLLEKKDYEGALIYLERLLQMQPRSLQVLFYLAEVYAAMDKEEKLIDIYIKILQIKPELTDVRLNLGYIYTKNGFLSRAKEEYERVLEAEPENEKAIFYLTYIYLSEGDTDKALQHFQRLDKRDLLNDEMLEDYAANLFIENQNPRPVLDRINDKEKITSVTRAIQYFIDGDIERAKEHFEKGIREDKDNIAGYIGLIRIAELKNNIDMEKKWRFVLAGTYYNYHSFEKAQSESKKVKEIDPDFLENRYLLGDIFRNLGMVEQAIEEYEYFEVHSQEKGDVYIKLGLSYDQIGKHEEAVSNFLQAIQLFPQNDELYYYLGVEYRILKEYENAISAFHKAIELNNNNAYFYFNLGVSYERAGKIDEAIVYLDKSVDLDDSNAIALNYLGYLLADKGVRLEEAKELIKKALKVDPDNGAYLDSIGWVYYKLYDFTKAKEYLEKAIQYMNHSEEENYVIYEHLGDTYRELGLHKDAIHAWEKALEMKDVEEIRLKIDQLKSGIKSYR